MNVTKNSSAFIRQTFLDYFFNNGHKFVRSSPVVPFCDPTLSFVNAGMNQFKNILLGNQLADNPRVVNSQKCIRVGGKHNDLSAVGHDTYHHTFFEMLGNWSFGDYFKKDACQMAWNFLTSSPISIPPNQLFVTYFNGDEKLDLPPDLETKEIWLSIGVDKDRVLPFGINDNFWEMGKIGPCGSCTEIHYDYLQNSSSNLERAKLVNKGYNDIIELWNIVFIQYNRGENGLLKPLPVNHVDTGMGFERFVAILQGSTSNYDTDLFSGIFDTITKFSGAQPYGGKFGASDKDGLDTAYRILADHTRMCAVALADNMFPDQNQKLKRVLRKALMIAETNFKVKNDYKLIEEIINRVSDSLSPTYPEIGNGIKKINFIVKNESELIKQLKSSTVKEWQSILKNDNRLSGIFSGVEAVALPAAYNELIYHINNDVLDIDQATNKKLINGDISLKLYDTYGLDVELIEDLVNALGCEFYKEDFDNKLAMLKEERMKNQRIFLIENTVIQNYVNKLTDSHVPHTDDSFKYCYKKDERNNTDNVNDASVSSYVFPDLTVNLQSIILLNNDNNNSNNVYISGDNVKLKSGDEVVFIVNKTNFYTEAGGQINDTGEIIMIDKNTSNIICVVDIINVLKYQGYILHIGKICELSPNVSSSSMSSSTENNELSVSLNDVKTVLKLNQNKRLNIMRNHTMTHLINAVLRNILTVTCQRSSYVNDDNLLFDFGIYNEKFSKDHVVTLENTIKQLINLKLPVNRTVVDSKYLLEYHNITLLPGETYPDNKITLIEIESNDNLNFISREPCCGTHVLNTGDIKDFCLVSVKNKGTNTKSIIAVTGDNARIAKKNDEIITNKITNFDEKLKKINDNLELVDNKLLCEFDTELINFKNELLNKRDEYFSYLVLCDAIESIDNYCKDIKRIARNVLREQLEIEMKNIVSNLSDNRKYLVYFVKSNSNLDDVSLSKVTRLCPPDLPVMLFSCSPDNVLKARCSIPQNLITSLTARNWIDSVCRTIGATESIIRGQDPKLVCGMKPKKIPQNKVNDLINIALAEAEVIAETAFH